MTSFHTSFVLGFHGCDEETAVSLLDGKPFRQSSEDFDWLGSGAYFWEGDPGRALEWAVERQKRGSYKKAAVVGAVIDLGNCLDLTVRENLDLLSDAYRSFEAARVKAGLALPVNKDVKGSTEGDKLLRFLDCAVIRHLHENIEDEARLAKENGYPSLLQPFDTVRGLFVEGKNVYPGGGFYEKTHTQIAVRSETNIIGVFRPRHLQAA